MTRVLILDGYVDEPGSLGVPPFLGFYPRYMAGAALDAGAGVDYATIDQWRNGFDILDFDMVVLVGGAVVPGKYLVTMPASEREMAGIVSSLKANKIPLALAGPIEQHHPSPPARLYDLLQGVVDANGGEGRETTMEEWSRWAVLGARIASQPGSCRPTIAEVETYRGCVRYISGGCLFCIEPKKGKPEYRPPNDIIHEIAALYDAGIKHFRLGGQTCIFSYMAEGVGDTQTPKPYPAILEELFAGVRKAAPGLRVLHVDNANPAVISAHPKESRRIAQILVEYCTPGNVLALGLESADSAVAKANNLNCTPEQAFEAVKMLNEEGGNRGNNGLPELLPGINFLGGLNAETPGTYRLNTIFLDNILSSDLLLRRINIRQVRWNTPAPFLKREYGAFKRDVRERIDHAMLKKLVPEGTVLKDVYTEMARGHVMYGRQIGSYPLLVGIPHDIEENVWVDVALTEHGSRSVTGVVYPMGLNKASLRAISALPGIGRKRALRIFHALPISNIKELGVVLESDEVARRIEPFVHM